MSFDLKGLINDDSVVGMASISFEKRCEIGEKDFLSTLPDDCILSVLSYVDCDSFDVMKQVSQKIHFLTHYKGSKQPKKRAFKFIIEQNTDGHTVCVTPWDRAEYSLVYTTTGDAHGVKTRFKGSYIDWKMNKTKTVTTSKENVFHPMKELSSKNDPAILQLIKVHIDEQFVQALTKAFNGKIPTELKLDGVTIDEKLNFSNFIIESKITCLHVYAYNHLSFFDEEFVGKFSLVDANRIQLQYSSFTSNRWTRPSNDFLPVICRFENLHLDMLTLSVNMLEELIVLSLEYDTFDSHKYWSFCLDSSLEENNLRYINNGLFSIERVNSNNPPYITSRYIIRKMNCTTHIKVISYKMNQGGSFPILIVLDNKDEEKEEY